MSFDVSGKPGETHHSVHQKERRLWRPGERAALFEGNNRDLRGLGRCGQDRRHQPNRLSLTRFSKPVRVGAPRWPRPRSAKRSDRPRRCRSPCPSDQGRQLGLLLLDPAASHRRPLPTLRFEETFEPDSWPHCAHEPEPAQGAKPASAAPALLASATPWRLRSGASCAGAGRAKSRWPRPPVRAGPRCANGAAAGARRLRFIRCRVSSPLRHPTEKLYIHTVIWRTTFSRYQRPNPPQ